MIVALTGLRHDKPSAISRPREPLELHKKVASQFVLATLDAKHRMPYRPVDHRPTNYNIYLAQFYCAACDQFHQLPTFTKLAAQLS